MKNKYSLIAFSLFVLIGIIFLVIPDNTSNKDLNNKETIETIPQNTNNTSPTESETISSENPSISETTPSENPNTTPNETIKETEPKINNGLTYIDYDGDSYDSKNNLISSPDITMTSELIENENVMPYMLYTPSTRGMDGKIPIIIYLHKIQHGSTNIDDINSSELPKALNNWNLDGLNAYIVCPQMSGNWNRSHWGIPHCMNLVDDIIDDIVKTHQDADTDKLIVMGYEKGAHGALFMSLQDTRYKYPTIIAIDPINLGITHLFEQFEKMNVRVYFGDNSSSDHENFVRNRMGPHIGEENIFKLDYHKDELSSELWLIDSDNDHKSDVFEWALSRYPKEEPNT